MPLILLPNLLGEGVDYSYFIPEKVVALISSLEGLIAESAKGGRVYLKHFNLLHKMPIALLNEHTSSKEIHDLLQPLLRGEKWGLITDCGLPVLADPGAHLVREAYRLNIAVEGFMGPSAIILALMLSGLPGQRFYFHGYFPREEKERKKHIFLWEKQSHEERVTQIFIETPYRNKQTFFSLLERLHHHTLLCVASHLTLPDQFLHTATVAEWKKKGMPPVNKKPTVFLFYKDARRS